jgi:hypothetical protein
MSENSPNLVTLVWRLALFVETSFKHACHRNLTSRTSMLAQVLQIFRGKEHLLKNWLISTLDKVIYFKGTIFQRSTKPLLTSQNRVEISWKKFAHFSNMLLLAKLLRFLWCTM